MYEPDPRDGISKIGNLYLLLGSKKVPLSFQTTSAEAQSAKEPPSLSSKLLLYFSPWRVYADRLGGKPYFGANGEYDPEFGKILKERLGGPSLTAQLETLQFLVDQGSRSFKFIADSLVDKSSGRFDEGLLKHNLASAVEKLESQAVHAPPQLSLELAMASYQNQDYKGAAHYFDRAGDGPIRETETLFYRGFARFQAEEYQRSADDLREFLHGTHKREFEAPAHVNLGNALWKLSRINEAIVQYNRAIQADHNYAPAYNNLAYMFAERGENLERALDLVNTALRLDADNQQDLSEDKDTKGWILFKSGKANEALPLIQEAASQIQNDPLVQSHLQVVQRAASPKGK